MHHPVSANTCAICNTSIQCFCALRHEWQLQVGFILKFYSFTAKIIAHFPTHVQIDTDNYRTVRLSQLYTGRCSQVIYMQLHYI